MNKITCKHCRRAMRLWAQDARRAPSEKLKAVCVSTAVSFRDGPCFHNDPKGAV